MRENAWRVVHDLLLKKKDTRKEIFGANSCVMEILLSPLLVTPRPCRAHDTFT